MLSSVTTVFTVHSATLRVVSMTTGLFLKHTAFKMMTMRDTVITKMTTPPQTAPAAMATGFGEQKKNNNFNVE